MPAPSETTATNKGKGSRRGAPASSGAMANIIAQGQENVALLEATFGPAPVTELATDYLRPYQANPRRHISSHSIDEMINGIRQADGEILQALLVRPLERDPEGFRYEVVCGNRRLLAARRLGMPKVPVRVREMDDEQAARFALWENLAREDLNPMDLAESIDGLRRVEKLSWERISERFGFSRQWGWKQQRLAELPEGVRDMVRDGKLSPSKAMLLSQVEDAQETQSLAERAITHGLSHRSLQNEVAALRCKHVLTPEEMAEDGDGAPGLVRESGAHPAADTEATPARKHVLTSPNPTRGASVAWVPPAGASRRRYGRLIAATETMVSHLNQGVLDADYARALRPLAEQILKMADESHEPDEGHTDGPPQRRPKKNRAEQAPENTDELPAA